MITLTFLGSFQVTHMGVSISHFRGDKVRGLLAYLAIESDRPHTRAALAALFWPNQPDRQALGNLSQALARLRAALGSDGNAQLHATRHSVMWRSGNDMDVATFTRLSTSSAPMDLEAAAALYHGEFLAGFGLADCDAFEEWLLLTRERLLQMALSVWERLADLNLASKHDNAAADAARKQLQLDPWRESAYRQLMRALAAAGDRAAALAAYERCRQILLADLGVEPDATTTMLADHIRYEQFAVSAQPSLPRPRSNLPAPLTTLIGREDELAHLDLLLRGEARLVTLHGPGGVGKTRLALAAATSLQDAFAAGACWVSLVGISTNDDAAAQIDGIAGTILEALGISAGMQHIPAVELREMLSNRELLLILDNCEHLPAVGPLVAELLTTAPDLRVLATSRERLGVYGEELLVLDGLSLPDEHATDVRDAAAVQLFVARAQRQVRRFGDDATTLLGVARLCRVLEGMPLGIELAAHWVGDYNPDEIAAALLSDLAFLQTRDRQIPDRHRSLRAVFDYSWRLLSEPEQQTLAQLSIFAGGFDRTAALAVTNTRPATLAAFVDKSLLRRVSAGRYSMHELVRQFAATQLDTLEAEREAMEAQHGSYYLTFVHERELWLTRNGPRQAIMEIHGDLDNIRQAWVWAATRGHFDMLDRVAHSLGQFYMQTGLVAEGAHMMAVAAEHIRAQPTQMGDQRVLSKMLAFQAMALNLQGAYAAALPLALQAMDLAQVSGCLEADGMAALVQGAVFARRGALQEAQPVFARVVQLTRSAPDTYPHAEALSEIAWRAEQWLGIIALMRGDYAEAREHINHALQVCQTRGSLVGEMNCLHRSITISLSDGDYRTARRDAEQALQLARTLGYRWGEGVAHLRLGQAVHGFSDYTQAAKLLEGALAIFDEIGDRTYAALSSAHLGRLATSLGDYAQARTLLQYALHQSQEARAHEPMLDALLFLALLFHQTGDLTQALDRVVQAEALVLHMSSRVRQAQVLVVRGRILASMQRYAEAVEAYTQALELYGAIGGQVAVTSMPQAGLAEVALMQGNLVQAQEIVNLMLSLLGADVTAIVDEPFELSWICYRVLRASHDVRATDVLRAAAQQLRTCAAQISNDEVRRMFLEQVVVHRELLRADTGVAVPTPLSAAQSYSIAEECH